MNNYAYKRGYVPVRCSWEQRLTGDKEKDEKNEIGKEAEIFFSRVKEMSKDRRRSSPEIKWKTLGLQSYSKLAQ